MVKELASAALPALVLVPKFGSLLYNRVGTQKVDKGTQEVG